MVPVFQMIRETTAQFARQTHIINFAPAIERVNALPETDILPHNLLILLQQIRRNIFQMLSNNFRFRFSQSFRFLHELSCDKMSTE